MKSGLIATLLLLGTLAPLTTALACPVDDAIDLATAIALCAASAVNPDGELTIGTPPHQTYVDTHPVCLN